MIKRFDECDRMSQIIVFDKYFKTAGQVAFEPSGDIKKQTKEALAELDALFEKIGEGDLIQIQIWLAKMNEIYDAWIKNYPKSVRACVGSALAEGYLVEIQAFGKLREN
ncbi:TPA: RidA family protein [Campylobacter jejuni]|nr:RidA family protein [Campylobacter jejuni]EFN6207160.1 RidA family protein [Campylobacter jejuni]HEC2933837.1 RidA family protein [Campylobacter jejuni]HEC2939113.1 RidA family protein [Campylobacter jejuni]HEC2940983.1 RidA family protein [Campylobacter jejuni]